jgi:hypothetical protein
VSQLLPDDRPGPPPAPKLDRRAWRRVGVGLGLLVLLTAIAAWVSKGIGPSSTPIYGNGSSAVAKTWTWDGSDFTAQPVTGSGPSSNDASMAYDRKRGEVVLWDHGCSRLVMGFTGGCQSRVDQTWTWSGRAWTRQNQASAPTAVGQGAMLYDGRLGQVVYVNRVGQAWAWTGSGWQALAWGGAPHLAPPGSAGGSALSLVAVGYDGIHDLIVLALPDATWTWNGRAWTQFSGGIDAADGQSDPRAVYDASRGRLVYLGARYLWSWDGSGWQAHPQPGLGGGTLGYDPLRKNVIVVKQDASACDSTACAAKVWAWDGSTWSAPAVANQPALPLTRSGAVDPPMAFDEARGVMVLFASAS